jgi:hypothetical protein
MEPPTLAKFGGVEGSLNEAQPSCLMQHYWSKEALNEAHPICLLQLYYEMCSDVMSSAKFLGIAYLQEHCGSLRLRGTQTRVQGLGWTEDNSKGMRRP